jgi:hypothetical protein
MPSWSYLVGVTARRDRPEWSRWPLGVRPANKQTVFRIGERAGVKAYVVKDRSAKTLIGRVTQHVMPASTIFTDEWPFYSSLKGTYRHHRIRHTEKIYVSGTSTRRPSRGSSRT